MFSLLINNRNKWQELTEQHTASATNNDHYLHVVMKVPENIICFGVLYMVYSPQSEYFLVGKLGYI